jgi:hypothetical protein
VGLNFFVSLLKILGYVQESGGRGVSQGFYFQAGVLGRAYPDDRANPKNIETLLALDLTRVQVRDILKLLRPEDYSQGPLPDELYHQSPMWALGKL